ncbi:MAG TPA: ribose-phosphate pyrophosphokinase [Thermodesulfovibrio thiophilus]|uniref:ribose-phosphate pyrophosphokinase n=1 Tax=Thermodesulfovibrio thiophilus TaxID=340095 RepID=UPI0004102B9B|nr:ribose-phosphate pyrophosphokinase [Thermodesulfovibrio thiophilus]HHW20419.1 ribose-phosphate pyrophosphokinase [Thermodesulfovibrio thiophilus]HOA83576.1 ribose-phosphate pyrophosphokinase [Thermodesulfovibrio thiophilus]HQA04253.1 ribose-phosphate pyrophosphokinase [Thermodesulfovibrio thiophilus]HQD36766.1 ribose-phosphate pyrophosphokinase [Thermodesulfovibrio thiophilus]
MPDGIKLITGNANPELAKKVSDYLEIPLTETTVSSFSDGEIMVQIKENVRGSDAFVIQPTCTPVNHNLMEVLLIIDALKRASARRITAVMPYYGYARQDRKVQPRVPISAKLVANLIATAGANRVLSIDLHAGQIQGFFDIPVDHLYAAPVILDYLKKNNLVNNIIVVSPDAGGTERARTFAKKINAPLAIIDKRRDAPNVSKVMHVIGDVKDKDALIIDDMIDTGGTMIQAAQALKDNGAQRVFAACTHAVLSGPAIDRINNSVLEEMIVTDTIPVYDKKERCPKIKVLTVAYLLGEAIKRIHEETSISSLFV